MSDGGEEEWKARILVSMTWGDEVKNLNERTSKVIFFDEQKLSEEELVLPFDGVLYVPATYLWDLSTEELDEEADRFEKLGCVVGGLEGKCLAIWVDSDDWDLKDTMVEKLRLKERNFEWCWDYVERGERENQLHIRLCQFFEENTQQCQVKPAKR